MPKLIINRARNPDEAKSISDRTTEINRDLKALIGGDLAKISDVAKFLGCSARLAYSYLGYEPPKANLPPVPHAMGTKRFRTVDVARRLAELEVICARRPATAAKPRRSNNKEVTAP